MNEKKIVGHLVIDGISYPAFDWLLSTDRVMLYVELLDGRQISGMANEMDFHSCQSRNADVPESFSAKINRCTKQLKNMRHENVMAIMKRAGIVSGDGKLAAKYKDDGDGQTDASSTR